MTGEETKHWTFHHLGVIVHDIEKAVEYYQSLGFVDFLDFSDVFPPRSEEYAGLPFFKELVSYGETILKDDKPLVPVDPEAKTGGVRFCKVGTITLELIQPPEFFREVNADFLKSNGEGISHIAYTVDAEHFELELEKMKAKGLAVLAYGRQSDGGGYAYFDTRKVGGVIVELMRGQGEPH